MSFGTHFPDPILIYCPFCGCPHHLRSLVESQCPSSSHLKKMPEESWYVLVVMFTNSTGIASFLGFTSISLAATSGQRISPVVKVISIFGYIYNVYIYIITYSI